MLERIKKSRVLYAGGALVGAWLVFIADASVSAASLFLWHEPDCPEELQE
jgi:cyclic lactone autoinducer peptide